MECRNQRKVMQPTLTHLFVVFCCYRRKSLRTSQQPSWLLALTNRWGGAFYYLVLSSLCFSFFLFFSSVTSSVPLFPSSPLLYSPCLTSPPLSHLFSLLSPGRQTSSVAHVQFSLPHLYKSRCSGSAYGRCIGMREGREEREGEQGQRKQGRDRRGESERSR